jgi:hypothetical protein
MFDKAILDTDRFMDMSMSAKALYFLLGMEADDEGFVSYKKVMRIHGGNEDDFKILVVKKFVIAFDSGVVVITDWNTNNYLDKNRIRETEYQKERSQLVLTDTNKYELNKCLTSIEENRIEQSSIGSETKVSDAKQIFEPIDLELSELLLGLIMKNTPTFKSPNLNQWATHVRLMRERDDRTEEQIRFVIEWCQKDNFWQANILSTKKLREKFDTLVAQIKRKVSSEQIKKSNVAFT